MFKLILAFISFIKIKYGTTTDITLSELEYISNHLEPEECQMLIFSLHSLNFDWKEDYYAQNNNSETIISCLDKLIEWNIDTVTQADLSRRLMQIGRKDLGNWLTQTVFKELEFNINESIIKNPFKDLQVQNRPVEIASNFEDVDFNAHDHPWKPIDTVLLIIIGCVIVSLIYFGYRILVMSYPECFKNQKKSYNPIST